MPESLLINLHRALKAGIGEFAGWVTAMDFGDPIKEVLETRNSVTIFDISHMGRIRLKGKDTYRLLDYLIPKDLTKIGPNMMSGPTAFLNENAGFKDDVMLYNLGEDEWFIVCNAVNREKILNWLNNWKVKLGLDVEVIDETFNMSLLALQGPKSPEVLEALGGKDAVDLKIMNFVRNVKLLSKEVFLVSRSGWTGEEVRSSGYEIITTPKHAEEIFKKTLELGAKPAGLIARDILRLEMGYVLYGEDISEDINPLEARYWVFSKGKTGYLGYEELRKVMKEGVDKVRVGFRLKKKVRAIPRHGHKVFIEDVEVGYVTSGNFSPTLSRPIAMGYIKSRYALFGLEVEIDIRGKRYKAKVVDFPFIKV